MYIDKENLFSNAQAVTTTAPSTNYIDLGSAGRDIGTTNIRFRVQVGTTFQSTGSSTCTIALQTDSTSAFSGPTTLFASAAIAKAAMVAGAVLVDIAVPRGTLRYLRANYTVATADFTAGTLTAFLAEQTEALKAYPNAI
jgi:hypothetical protein